MKNAANIITRPIMANINLLFAEANFSGSPRDIMYCVPEIITITKARKLPTIIRLFTTVWKKAVPEVSSPPRSPSGTPDGAAKD